MVRLSLSRLAGAAVALRCGRGGCGHRRGRRGRRRCDRLRRFGRRDAGL